MSTKTTSKPSVTPAPASQPSDDDIRGYANHLFVQHGCVDGHDRDDWLEAEACLRAGIPQTSTRTRVHHHTQVTERAAIGLVKHGKS